VLEFQDNATECCVEDAKPVPDSAMVIGEFLALLVTVRLPAKFPLVKGVNVARTEVDCLGPTVTPEALPLAVNPGPDTETPEIVTLERPVLVNVTVCTALLASAVWPKFKLLTLATSGDEDAVTVVGGDDRATLQMLSAPAEAITPMVSSTETELWSVRNAKFEPNVTCPELSTTYAL
jgi:hypothetical protein